MSYEQFAYSYDRLMEDMPYSEWIAFAKKAWEIYGLTPETVVDLGCGTGSIAIPLAQMGLKVIGIDLSEDMLAVAQHKSEQIPMISPRGALIWMQQDLLDWELPEPVDTAISFCDCFNYLLEEEEIEQAFQQTFQGLKPGGLFMFDVHTPQQLQAYAESQPFILNEEDIAYIWTCELDEERTEIEHDLTIFVKANEGSMSYHKIEEQHTQRAYSIDWLEQQLKDAGFIDIRVGADFEWKAPTSDAQRVFFSARKPEISAVLT